MGALLRGINTIAASVFLRVRNSRNLHRKRARGRRATAEKSQARAFSAVARRAAGALSVQIACIFSIFLEFAEKNLEISGKITVKKNADVQHFHSEGAPFPVEHHLHRSQ